MIDGLAGVLLYTTADRWAAMAAFYNDALALPVRHRRAGFVNFDFGGQRLTIAVHDRLRGAALDPERIMVNLSTGDIVAEADRLRAAGVDFVRPPERERWGGWVATMRDPDGNLVQLLQLAP